MSTPDNQPERAFPSLETNSRGELYYDHLGMTLRDWFAGQALAGLSANPREDYSGTTRDDKAVESYRQADAMIAARERKGGVA
jgi:hypothetical protein